MPTREKVTTTIIDISAIADSGDGKILKSEKEQNLAIDSIRLQDDHEDVANQKLPSSSKKNMSASKITDIVPPSSPTVQMKTCNNSVVSCSPSSAETSTKPKDTNNKKRKKVGGSVRSLSSIGATTKKSKNGSTALTSASAPTQAKKKGMNQPSIGSFFTKMKPKKGSQSKSKLSKPTRTKTTVSNAASTNSGKKAVKSSHGKSLPSTPSPKPATVKQTVTKKVTSTNKKPTSTSTPKQSPIGQKSTNSNINNKEKKQTLETKSRTSISTPTRKKHTTPKKKGLPTVTHTDDILAIVLGTTHDEDTTKSTSTSSSSTTKSTSRSPKKVVHLPDLITQTLKLQNNTSATYQNNDDKYDLSNNSTNQITTKRKRVKDPLKPKHFRSSYLYYRDVVSKNVTKDHPDLKFGEVSKLISKMFKELAESEKKVYVDLAEKDRIRYQKEMEEYRNKANADDTKLQQTKASLVKSVDENTESDSVITDKKEDIQKQKDEKVLKGDISGSVEGGENVNSDSDDVKADSIVDVLPRNDSKSQDDNSTSKEIGESANSDSCSVKANPMADASSSDDNKSQEQRKTKTEMKEPVVVPSRQLKKIINEINTETIVTNIENVISIKGDKEKETKPLEEIEKDEDITLGSDEDNDEQSCDDETEDATGDKEFLALDDEIATCTDKPTEEVVNKDEPNENNKKKVVAQTIPVISEKNTINVLQPRKKSKESTVHILQPRKKLKVNELKPRKKIKLNDSTPRKIVDKTPASPELKTQEESNIELPIPVKEVTTSEASTREKTEPIKVDELKPKKKKARIHQPSLQTKSILTSTQAAPVEKNEASASISATSTSKLANCAPLVPLSQEEEEHLTKYRTMRSQYFDKMKELVENAMNGGVEEEDFQMNIAKNEVFCADNLKAAEGVSIITSFEDNWVEQLAVLVQGSPLSLPELSKLATKSISDTLEPNITVALDTVTAKIKLLAARTQYLSSVPVSDICSNTTNNNVEVDIFTDKSGSNMWRWELISLDLLPDDKKASVKKARTARKKLKNHQKAILKLIQSIDDYEVQMKNRTKSIESLQSRVVKISADEEKVLRFEREAEKLRLQREKKIRIDREKMQKLVEKEAEKDRKKEEAVKKQKEKERLEAEKDRRKEEATKKQKVRMLSFFSNAKTKQDVCNTSETKKSLSSHVSSSASLESSEFWKELDSGKRSHNNYFSKLSRKAVISRQRKTLKVNVRVFATVTPENPFEQQPYDEERTISVWNKNKYLSFHEDYRPPYHGTWTKGRSSIISGKNPFGKDSTSLNYEVDSEAEWEEDDNEQGDDCSAADNDEEEIEDNEDTTNYNYQDGWLTQDGDLALEDDDEETMAMRRQKAETKNVGNDPNPNNVVSRCVIAPLLGGLPQLDDECLDDCPQLVPDLFEGVEIEEAMMLLTSHGGEIITPSVALCLDPFPPTKECDKKLSGSKPHQEIAIKKPKQEMSDEDMKTFARFVHNSTLKSKELVVEELRLAHREIVSSRAQAHRKLALIARKRRLKNGGGVIWEVKDAFLKSLGLNDLMKPPPDHVNEDECITDKKKAKITKGAEDLNTPALVSPMEKTTSKRRKQSEVSKASANLLASFLKRKKVSG